MTNVNWIDSLSSSAQNAIRSAMVLRRFEKGALVFSRTETPAGVYLLTKGTAYFSLDSETGKRILLHIIKPGQLFGETVAFDGLPAPTSVEARSSMETLFLATPKLEMLRSRYPEIGAALAGVASSNLRRVLTILDELLLAPLSARAERRLRFLAMEAEASQQRQGYSEAHGIVLDIRQSEFAAMLGVSRQATNAVLQDLERQGVLTCLFGKILYRDLARIA